MAYFLLMIDQARKNTGGIGSSEAGSLPLGAVIGTIHSLLSFERNEPAKC